MMIATTCSFHFRKKSKKRGGTRAGGASKPGAHRGTGVPPDPEGQPPGSRPPSTIPQHVLEGVTSGGLHSPLHSGSQISMAGDTVSDMDNHRQECTAYSIPKCSVLLHTYK